MAAKRKTRASLAAEEAADAKKEVTEELEEEASGR
jgi:hypothetical protein